MTGQFLTAFHAGWKGIVHIRLVLKGGWENFQVKSQLLFRRPTSANMMNSETSDRKQGGYDPGNGELIIRLLKLAWKYRVTCMHVIVLQLILTVIGLAGLGLTGLGIDYLRFELDPTVGPPGWPLGLAPPADMPPMKVLLWISAGILGFGVIHFGLFFVNQMAVGKLVHEKIVADLRRQVYRKLQRLSFRFFDGNESGSLINRVTGDVQAVRVFVDGVLLQLFTLGITLSVYLFYMLNIHVTLTLLCLSTLPVLYLLTVFYSRKIRPLFLENRRLMDRLVLNFAESVFGINTIKGFALEEAEIDRFRGSAETVRQQRRKIFRLNSRFRPTVEFLTQVSLVILLGYGGYLAIRGEIAVGTGLVVFARILQQFGNQVTAIAEVADGVQLSLTGARRVFEIIDADPDVSSSPTAKPFGRVRGRLEYRGVTFSHAISPRADISGAGDAQWMGKTLEDISFEVKPGELVAIAGATGSGKTALLSLVPRFYDPQHGQITLDGSDLRDLHLESLRRNIGIVFQENFLFSNTIAENIAFGNPDATAEQIMRAAEIACAHHFIMEMEKGYNTLLGEGGMNLSGGQRQRLAIARALILDPSILLLDDPTTAIDPETEHEILEAMDRALEGRTTLLVAHRLSTLRRAHRILVLDKGRIIQQGTHSQLMDEAGPYRQSIHLQEIDAQSREILKEVGMWKGEAV